MKKTFIGHTAWIFGLCLLQFSAYGATVCQLPKAKDMTAKARISEKVPFFGYSVRNCESCDITVMEMPRAFTAPDLSTSEKFESFVTKFQEDRSFFHGAVGIEGWTIQDASVQNNVLELNAHYVNTHGDEIRVVEWEYAVDDKTCMTTLEFESEKDQSAVAAVLRKELNVSRKSASK